MSKKNYKETYFQHDRYARQDPKIKSMLVHFRKESEDKAKAAVCVFWWIVEDMHIDDYPIDKLDVFADDYRCDVDFLKSILEDFDLFRIEDGCYVSDRVLKNLKEQEEKSEKARAKAQKRWKKKEEDAAPDEADLEIVNSIIQLYNTAFKKTQIVGKDNREKIYKINKDNKLTLDIWQKVFDNARRGWDIKGEHKIPNLKNILDNWDAFASDDYYLAPDYEKIAAAKKAKEVEAERAKEAERLQREKEIEEYNNEKDAICDVATAIAFINKHNRMPESFLRKSSTVREYMQQYNFTVEDVIAARKKEGEQE